MGAKYQLLADQLREELQRNSAQKGRRLPTELELTQRYHVSRQTVRHALRLLEDEGLIRRRQGSGSYATGLIPDAPSRQIAVVASSADDYIFPTILHDVSEVFTRHGYSAAVYSSENQVSKRTRDPAPSAGGADMRYSDRGGQNRSAHAEYGSL